MTYEIKVPLGEVGLGILVNESSRAVKSALSLDGKRDRI